MIVSFYIFSLLKFSQNSSSLLSSLVSIFVIITLTLYEVYCISTSHLIFFFKALSCSFIWSIFSISLCCLSFCAYFHEIGRTTTSPKLKGILMCRLGIRADLGWLAGAMWALCAEASLVG